MGSTGATLLAKPEKPYSRDRLAILRAHVEKDSKILEIGPSFNAIAPKRDGYNAFSVDKHTKAELIEIYRGHRHVDTEQIEDVDFVWRTGDMSDSIDKSHHHSFDVILLSHVLEHVPDPIRFLRSMETLLRPGGRLTMALPDKRYCFDYLRPTTTTGAWLEAFQNEDNLHSRRSLFDFNTTAVARDGGHVWLENEAATEQLTFVGKDINTAHRVFLDHHSTYERQYEDCHAWVFTPSSFALIVNEVHALGLAELVPEFISTVVGSEFFVHMRLAKRRPITAHERLYFLVMSAKEQGAGFARLKPPGWRGFRTMLSR